MKLFFKVLVFLAIVFNAHAKEKEIDLLSLDTEGSELMILESIDFSYYYIKVMILEYNYHNEKILKLLNQTVIYLAYTQ